MNQFLVIIRGTDHSAASPEKMQNRLNKFGEWVQTVLGSRYVSGAPLEDTDAHLLKSKTEIFTDGPFVESKEMISGYLIFQADDIKEAVELTKQCPLLEEFQLEVRKLKPMQ